MIWIRYQRLDGATGEYVGTDNPDQSTDEHLGLVLVDSTTLREYLDTGEADSESDYNDGSRYQERAANGAFKKLYRRFIRANILEEKVLTLKEAKDMRKKLAALAAK